MAVDPRRAAYEYFAGGLRALGVWYSPDVLMRGVDKMTPDEAKEVLTLSIDVLRGRARGAPDRWDPTHGKMINIYWYHNY